VDNLWKTRPGNRGSGRKIKIQAGCLFSRIPSRGLEIWGSKRYNDKHNKLNERSYHMAGTVAGGKKAAAKNLQNNPNFYRDIGRIGGRNGNTGGFAANPQLARIAGAKGGRISRRRSKKVTTGKADD
jgi:general stress protein YciG